jgi:hypothetical protein
MVGVKTLTFIQVCIDICFLTALAFSGYKAIFSYMSDYNIGILTISYEYTDQTTDLSAYIIGIYADFNTYICDDISNFEGIKLNEICNSLTSFKTAGIVYLVGSCLAVLAMFYGFIHLIARLFKSTKAALTFPYLHLIYPCLYSVTLACYLGISEIFTLSPPSSCKNSCKVSVKSGLIAIFLGEAFALTSMLFYYFTRKRIKSMLDSELIDKA